MIGRKYDAGVKAKSMSIPVSVTPAGVLFLLALTGHASAADAEHGKVLFQACAACHSDRAGSLGPNLQGVFGRNSAALDDFQIGRAHV